MIQLNDTHKKKLQYHGGRVSQKLTNMVHESHYQKVILHNKHGDPLLKFPLLLGIIITLLFPILIGIALTIFFVMEGNLIVEKEA